MNYNVQLFYMFTFKAGYVHTFREVYWIKHAQSYVPAIDKQVPEESGNLFFSTH